jgi:hypothetical protein
MHTKSDEVTKRPSNNGWNTESEEVRPSRMKRLSYKVQEEVETLKKFSAYSLKGKHKWLSVSPYALATVIVFDFTSYILFQGLIVSPEHLE